MATELVIDNAFVKPYWGGNKQHAHYMKAVDAFHHMSFHADGYFLRPWQTQQTPTTTEDAYLKNYYFERLIDNRRPKESDAINAYRKDRYFPRTKMVVSKVINSLRKIVKSREWNIDYKNAETPPKLDPKNSLYTYCEKEYPKYDSIEHWAYTIGIRNMLVDPNALLVVMPLDFNIAEGDFYRPFIHIIPCKDVLDYQENNFCVFRSPYKSVYMYKGEKREGKQLIIATANEFYLVNQINEKGNFSIELAYQHSIGEMPAWIMGGIEKTTNLVSPYCESFISDMLPALDQAAIDFSDLEAEKSQHLHTTVWVVQTQECSLCQGTGKVKNKGKNTKCPQCGGRGAASQGPYQELIVNLNNLMDPNKNIPIPPMGIVEKDISMVKEQREIIREELYEAAAAINMEFLMEEPLNESGKAKEVDRDELNNFVYAIAYHLVENIMNPAYYFINEMRYKLLITDVAVREKMLPQINVPETFDILTKSAYEDNLLKISKSEVNDEIKELYEKQFINEVFQDDPEVRDKLMTAHAHNPLPGMSLQDITTGIRSNLIKTTDAVLSLYLKYFINQILAEPNNDFLKKPWEEQHEILVAMAEEKAAENSTADDVMALAGQQQEEPDEAAAAMTPGKIKNKKTQFPSRKKSSGNPSNTGA